MLQYSIEDWLQAVADHHNLWLQPTITNVFELALRRLVTWLTMLNRPNTNGCWTCQLA